MDVDEHLFRREARRLVSALTRIFGVHNLALAEDVAQGRLLPGPGRLKAPVRGRSVSPAKNS
jgi:hypothetical protein